MTIRVTIKHDQEPPFDKRLAVTVVTVGDLTANEQKHLVGAGEQVTVHVHQGQFVMVDETDKEGG